MDDERLSELIVKFDAATLGPEEAEELRATLASSPDLKKRVGEQIFLTRVLRASHQPTPDVKAFMARLPAAPAPNLTAPKLTTPKLTTIDGGAVATTPPPRPARPRRLWVPMAAAITVAAAAGFVVGIGVQRTSSDGTNVAMTSRPIRSRPPSLPVVPEAPVVAGPTAVAAVRGTVERLDGAGETPRPGDPLPQGSWLSAGASSAVTLTLPTGTVELGAHGVLGVLAPAEEDAQRLFVAHGQVEVRPAPVANWLRIDTPHARVRLEGARGAVIVRDRETRIALESGNAQVHDTTTGKTTSLHGQQAALVIEGGDAGAAVAVLNNRSVLLVVGLKQGKQVYTADEVIRDRLVSLGYDVEIARADQPPPPLEGRALIVLSSSIDSKEFGWDIKNLAVPMLSWESMIYMRLGWVEDSQKNLGRVIDEDSVVIKDTSHPLAAGLQGRVKVSTKRGDFAWGYPSAWGAFVAHPPTEPTEFVIFAYDTGTKMPYGVTAPARRVGFFPFEDMPLSLTPEGWKLFDAAVKWAAGETK